VISIDCAGQSRMLFVLLLFLIKLICGAYYCRRQRGIRTHPGRKFTQKESCTPLINTQTHTPGSSEEQRTPLGLVEMTHL